MSTNAESSDNIVYSLLGLNAEVGEINDKIAKWRRKGMANIDNNKLVFTTSSEVEATYLRNELLKEVGDVLWFCAHLSRQLNATLDDADIDKLLNAGISNSQLYKCAGNSITVDVLYHIFRKAYIDKGCETIQPTLF